MNLETKLLEIAAYTVPAIVTGGIAFLFCKRSLKMKKIADVLSC
jgi:hypothetical protein